MESCVADTTLLIDLQKDRRRRGAPSGATAFLRSHPEIALYLPIIVKGEYLEGFADPDSAHATVLIASMHLLEITDPIARLYARTSRALRQSGQLIGTNDLWIGCTALHHGFPLLTQNSEHFSRIAGLTVIAYGPARE